MNFGQLILNAAAAVNYAPAVSCQGRALDYRELSERASRIGNGLLAQGLSQGDRVLLQMHNCLEYPEVMIGAWAAGLIVVPVNAKLHAREVEHILENSGARLIFASDGVPPLATDLPVVRCESPEYAALLMAEPLTVCAERAQEDMAWLFYTSGTTGRPKGAMLSNRNLLAMANAYYADIDRLGPEDAMLVAAPASHGAGLYMLAALLKGAKVVISAGFNISEAEEIVRTHPSVSLFAVPTILNRLTSVWSGSDVPVENIRTIIYGGAPMYVADLERAISVFGPHLFQLFAQGESPMTVSGLPQRLHRTDLPESPRLLSSCGYPRTGCCIRICDPDTGAELPSGQTGEICAQGEAVMLGYWKNPDATSKALRDGWLWTGDLGFRDSDGLLHVVDRSKDLIISGGTNIYPREVEEVLLTHPGVAEVAVIGMPDSEWGESVVACVVRDSDSTVGEAELDAHVCAQIARFKRPKVYRFLNELPKSDYAKVLKSELRKMLEEEPAVY